MYETIIGSGKHQVKLQALNSENGWCILLTGGETPHIGGVVMAVPRLSLTGKGQSCDLYVVPVSGHKDTDVAGPLAEDVCRHTGRIVTVSAGIHIENAALDDLRLIAENCRSAGQAFLIKVSAEPQKG